MLRRALDQSTVAKPFFEKALRERETLSEREYMQRRVDRYNAEPGNLNVDDGYNCPLCMNRGTTAILTERNGVFYDCYPPCRCMEIRMSIRRMRASGLENSIKEYTFAKFRATTDWQRTMLMTAERFVEEGAKAKCWLFIGGAVGAGKTHICTAVAGKLLYLVPVHYMIWPSESARLKSIVNDDEEYGRAMSRLKTVDVLYIDDFFKPIMGEHGPLPPTPADVRLAYEIINHRYVNRLVTIISSERYLSELMDIDDATVSRIAERAKGYCLTLARDRAKNQRITSDNPI